MTYTMKPLACDPTRIKGMSEQLIVSHYENNYGGAVRRLNAITAQLAELDFATAPVFVVNGLKREELVAANSMILHELFFASLATASSSITGRWITRRRSPVPPRYWRSICMSTPITWITGREPPPMSMPLWRR